MKKYMGLLVMLATVASCSSEGLNSSDFVAGDTFTDSNIRVLLIDSLAVETSTMKFDSIITSNSSRMLIGQYTDPVFGTVRSSSYVELLPNNYTINTDAVYDSIVFLLKYDDYYYNDTLQSNTIHIRELTESLKPSNGSYLYNTSSIDHGDTDLGSLTYYPRPLGSDSLQIRLNDDFGTAMFERLENKSITNIDEFKDYFKGLLFQPDEVDNGSVIGFLLASSVMRLYSSVYEEKEKVQYHIDFTINTSSSPVPFFNQIIAIDPIEALNGLTNGKIDLCSSETSGQSYIQSGIGIATKVKVPHLKSVFDIKGKGTLLNAFLKIKPIEGTYDNRLKLRDTLSVFEVDRNNTLIEQLSGVGAVLNRTGEEYNDIYYELPLTGYIEKMLLEEGESGQALILFPDSYNSTVDRFVLTGDDNSGYRTTLELIYAIYDED